MSALASAGSASAPSACLAASPSASLAASPLRIVFMGTPAFAATVLRHVADWPGGTVVAAYCQPDRPAGRGHKLTPSAVKISALERGIPVRQPQHFREQADRDELASFHPDVLVVAAYGLILPQAVLDMPRIGPFNVHGSLLPRYRGAAPIQRAIMDGNTLTGVTIMRMERGLDTGPILAQRATGIDLSDTAATLYVELAELGGALMVETLERFTTGTTQALPTPAITPAASTGATTGATTDAIGHATTGATGAAISDPTALVPPTPIAQDEARATTAAKLTKADGAIRWDRPVREIHARIRGVTPWPGAQTVLLLPGREPLVVHLQPGTIGADFAATPTAEPAAASVSEPAVSEPAVLRPTPGTLIGLRNGQLGIACADALYLLSTLKPAAGKPMSGEAFWNGYCRAPHGETLRAVSPEQLADLLPERQASPSSEASSHVPTSFVPSVPVVPGIRSHGDGHVPEDSTHTSN